MCAEFVLFRAALRWRSHTLHTGGTGVSEQYRLPDQHLSHRLDQLSDPTLHFAKKTTGMGRRRRDLYRQPGFDSGTALSLRL